LFFWVLDNGKQVRWHEWHETRASEPRRGPPLAGVLHVRRLVRIINTMLEEATGHVKSLLI